jgi:hypothetical protein
VAKVLGTATEADQVRFRPDSALDVSRFAYLYNTGTNILVAPSGLSRPEMYSRLQQNELNAGLQEDLAYLKASANYFSYNKTEGLKQLSLLAENAVKNKPMYDQNLGLWFLKEGVYDKAVYYLNRAGDSSSVALLAAQKYSETLDERLELQAGNIVKGGITAGNLGELLNKAPLNPYLLEKVTQYLSGIKRDGEAYNLLFYATDLNPSSAKLWKLYVYKALDMSQTGYADNGLAKLKTLLPAGEYEQFKSLFELKKAERQKKAGNF